MAPKQKPGKSEQAVGTPPDLISAVKRLLGIEEFQIDLAADSSNTQAQIFYSEEQDALSKDWTMWVGWCWLNPPFSHIAPWVEKAKASKDPATKIAVLVPASVGSNWWRDHVHGHCEVHFLNGRPTFVGHTDPYPKDLALLLYGRYHRGYYIWDWRHE